jgi:hypothetical protein
MTMLHLLLGRNPWFRAKDHGYGAGLPIAWQGWALILSYIAAVVGIGLLLQDASAGGAAGLVALITLLTAIFIVVAKARTEGGWRWRWGDDG